MQTLRNIEQLDERIAACVSAPSDAALRELFKTFKMMPPAVKDDPFSAEYAREQMELYERISGRQYRLENEETQLNVEELTHRPFPYCTDSLQVVGDQLVAIGSLLRRMNVPKAGRVLEFGPGHGNTTMALALAGYQVTAVDIEARYCDLIQRRAAKTGVEIEVINSDFMWSEQVTDPYDAVVFFECFHHCADHMRLLRALQQAVKPEGRVYFAGEPITNTFPVPWGLRLDGESLWAIRKHGWLELGFTETYFRKALAISGWNVTKFQSTETFAANVWEAERIGDGEKAKQPVAPAFLGPLTAIDNFQQAVSRKFTKLIRMMS